MLGKLRAALNGLLAPAEDPRRGSVPERQIELLQRVREALTHVSASRIQLEGRTVELERALEALRDSARKALGEGREDVAMAILERRRAGLLQMRILERQVGDLAGEEGRLRLAEQQLAGHI